MLKTYHIRERHGNRWCHVGGFNSCNHDRANVRENLRRYAAAIGVTITNMARYSVKASDVFEPQCRTF